MKSPGRQERSRAPWWSSLWFHLVLAYGVVAVAVYLRAFPFRSKYMGKIWLTPLYSYWNPALHWWFFPALLFVAAGAWLVWQATAGRGRPWRAALGALVAMAGVNLAPGPDAGRWFPARWLGRFIVDARWLAEQVDGVRRFAELSPYCHMHTRVRPGGVVALVGALDSLFAGDVILIQAVFMVLAALAVVPVFYAARAVVASRVWPALLFTLAPSLLLYGSSPDGFAAALGATVLAAGYVACFGSGRGRGVAAAGAGAALGLSLCVTYTLAATAVFLSAWTVAGIFDGSGVFRKRVVNLGVIFAVALAVLAAVQLVTGYDHLAQFRAAYVAAQKLPSGGGNVVKFVGRALGWGGVNLPKPSGERSYWIYTFGNLYSFFFFTMGVPAGVLYLRGLWRAVRGDAGPRENYARFVISSVVAFLLYNFSGLVLGEVERLWIYLLPVFVIPAGVELGRLAAAPGGKRVVGTVVVLLLVQALTYNVLLLTNY